MRINKPSLSVRIFLAIISSAMIVPLSLLESSNPTIIYHVTLIDILIGTVFALSVMVPFQKKYNLFKIVLMAVCSICIYALAIQIATTEYQIFNYKFDTTNRIILSGAFGALMTGIVIQLIAPLKLKLKAYPMLIITGLITGYVFSLTIDSQLVAINALGYMAWQVGVCITVFSTKVTKKKLF